MSSRAACRRFRRALLAVALAELPLRLDDASREHLCACRVCRAELRIARAADSALRSLGDEAIDDDGFRDLETAIVARVRSARAAPTRRLPQRIAAAAAVLALFWTGVVLSSRFDRPDRSSLLDQPAIEGGEPFAFDPHGSTYPVGQSPYRGLRGRALLETVPERRVVAPGPSGAEPGRTDPPPFGANRGR
ncbi:MAG: hypothetical protein HZB39_20670 [Planctomycetes bacterium]|nr:hypothetical protein [Planctomycetota bacterium]